MARNTDDKSKAPSSRTRVKRYHWLADYDHKTVHAILDAVPLCHVGYDGKDGPYVTSTLQWREGDRVYWHGSSASRMLKTASNNPVCMAVSSMDGLVLARSAFNFNINFRSVMLFGVAEPITETDEKTRVLRLMMERFVPGHWDVLRPVTPQEIKATTVLSMVIDEVSAKVRTGQPVDNDEDYDFPAWAGYVPIRREILPPVPDPRNLPGVNMPAGLAKFSVG